MTWEQGLTIAGIIFAAGGAWVILARLQKDREDDKLSAETQRDEDLTKHREQHDHIWNKLHELEAQMNAHEKASYEERLKIAEKFSTQAIAQANVAGQLNLMAAELARFGVTLKEISEEVKRK